MKQIPLFAFLLYIFYDIGSVGASTLSIMRYLKLTLT